MREAARRLGIAAVATAIAVVAAADVRAQSGVVHGIVFDSIGGAPLADAAVFLWDTQHRAVTDEDGAYRIEGIPPGEYSVLFFHTVLGEMGVSPGPVPVTIREGTEQRLTLGTPSVTTMLAMQCLMEDRPAGVGAVVGRVRDALSDVALVGAEVTLSWDAEGEREPRTLEAYSSSDGWYAACSVPAGVPVLVSAGFYGRESIRREVRVAESGFVQAAIDVYDTRASQVGGVLADRVTGAPVEGAVAWLRGTGIRTVTNGEGRFRFRDVQPGTYMLMTDHLAYGTKMDTLFVPHGERLEVSMLVDNEPIEIAPLVVTTEASPVTMDRVRGGIVVTEQEIDEVRQTSRDASDILRSLHLPGVIVRPLSDGTICVGYSTGQVRMFQSGCVPMLIYLNDVRATDPNLALRLPPDAVQRMVIYKPLEAGNLFGLGAGNGVWMIYTRGN